MVSSDVSSDYSHFGDKQDDNGPTTFNNAIVIASENIPNCTTNFTDITIEPLSPDSGPSLPKTFMFLWQLH